MTRPDLHIVPPVWNRAEAYRPDPRPSWFATLIADFREFWSEVADAPAHHAGFAILVVVAWTTILAAPLYLGLLG